MKKIVTSKMIAIGALAFATLAPEASGVFSNKSDRLQKDFAAAYGLGADKMVKRTVTGIDGIIKTLRKVLDQVKTTNKTYEIASPDEIKKVEANLKTLDAFKGIIEYIRDSKKNNLLKAKPNLDFLPELIASLKTIAERGKIEEIDDSKVRDKTVSAAVKKKTDALKALELAEAKLREAEAKLAETSGGVQTSVQKFNAAIAGIQIPTIEVPKLKVASEEIEGSDALKKVEESFEKVRTLVTQLEDLQRAISGERTEATTETDDAAEAAVDLEEPAPEAPVVRRKARTAAPIAEAETTRAPAITRERRKEKPAEIQVGVIEEEYVEDEAPEFVATTKTPAKKAVANPLPRTATTRAPVKKAVEPAVEADEDELV
jgi:hypothetical protein